MHTSLSLGEPRTWEVCVSGPAGLVAVGVFVAQRAARQHAVRKQPGNRRAVKGFCVTLSSSPGGLTGLARTRNLAQCPRAPRPPLSPQVVRRRRARLRHLLLVVAVHGGEVILHRHGGRHAQPPGRLAHLGHAWGEAGRGGAGGGRGWGGVEPVGCVAVWEEQRLHCVMLVPGSVLQHV